MSFDLYFVRPGPDGSLDPSTPAFDVPHGPPMSEVHLRTWTSIVSAVSPLLDDPEPEESDRSCELTDFATGLQVFLGTGELVVSVPYWDDEPDDADRTEERLRAVVAAIEEETGLVAFDPQNGVAFLAGPSGQASGSIAATSSAVQDLATSDGDGSAGASKRRGWFRRGR